MKANAAAARGIRIHQLRLAGGVTRPRWYVVNFKVDGPLSAWRPLSVIAGPSQTGKTSTIDFALYCLGASEHPQHPEVLANVRSALLECELAGTVETIERSAIGPPSRFASVWAGGLADVEARAVSEERRNIEPTSDPLGLSQSVLAACDLNGIELPEAPTQQESRSQILSVRDLFRFIWLPNERLDSNNLAFENSHHMIGQKFRQTVEAIFEIDDQEAASRAARIRTLAESVRAATSQAESLRSLVHEEFPGGSIHLETLKTDAETELSEILPKIHELDNERVAQERGLEGLRKALSQAEKAARAASLRVRNRESLLDRLGALRGQYADDKKKLTFLKEAERFFDPLHLAVCPACMSRLEKSPAIDNGHCSMCGSDLDLSLSPGDAANDDAKTPDLLTLIDAIDEPDIESSRLLEAELRATSARLADLNDYWSRLDADLRALRQHEKEAIEEVGQAEQGLTAAISLPAPFLATRDELRRRVTSAELRKQSAETGLRLWSRVEQLEVAAARLAAQLRNLRAEHRDASARPDRDAVISRLSRRFGAILEEIGYPKLSEAVIDNRLLPHVRGLPYTAASSGGRVLIALAYYLALWQVSYEESPRAPGILIIDSPQKNLGHAASRDDPDFADSQLVENFYQHVKRWLAGNGWGAQLVVIDNSPPASVEDDVVVRYTRDRTLPPYGLIDDAVD